MDTREECKPCARLLRLTKCRQEDLAVPGIVRRDTVFYSMMERSCVALHFITMVTGSAGPPTVLCQVKSGHGRLMLSLGLRARCTPSLLALTPSYVSFTRHLTRWPSRRSRIPPPHPLRSGVIGRPRSFAAYSIAVAFGAGVGFIAYENYQPFRHTVLAVVRCSRVASE